MVGMKQHAISIMDPETEVPLSAKETADYINSFFTDLTKNYPEVSDEWLSMEIQEPLPQISVESLMEKLRRIDANKARVRLTLV